MRPLKIAALVLLLLVGAAALLFWRMPAEFAYRYGTRYLGAVALNGIGGTLWDGHADALSVLGRDLGEVEWHAQKWPLLGGRFVADLRVKGADVDMAGTLERDDDGTFGVHEMRFSVPAATFAPALEGLRGVEVLGTVSGVVKQARFATSMLSDVSGDARWSGAGVSGAVEAHFTDMLADFASQPDGSVGGRLRDDGNGNLAVDGSFKVSFSAFEADATLRARNGDPQVADLLRHLGEPQADGSTHVVVRGQTLKPF